MAASISRVGRRDQLRAVAEVDLVAVVLRRVVAGGDHHPGRAAEVADGEGEHRRRQRAGAAPARRTRPRPAPRPWSWANSSERRRASYPTTTPPPACPSRLPATRRCRRGRAGDHGGVHAGRPGAQRAAQPGRPEGERAGEAARRARRLSPARRPAPRSPRGRPGAVGVRPGAAPASSTLTASRSDDRDQELAQARRPPPCPRRGPRRWSSGSPVTPAAALVTSDRPEHLQPGGPRGDGLERGRHADQVRADRRAASGSRPASRSAARAGRVDALGQRRVDLAGQRPQSRRVQVGEVDEVSRRPAGSGAVRLRWSAISTGCPTRWSGRAPPAALVRTTVRTPAAAAVRTPCATASDAAALVEVRAAEEHQHAAVARRRTSGPRRRARSPSAAAKPGSSPTAIAASAGPNASAAGAQPEPMTTATSAAASAAVSAAAAARARVGGVRQEADSGDARSDGADVVRTPGWLRASSSGDAPGEVSGDAAEGLSTRRTLTQRPARHRHRCTDGGPVVVRRGARARSSLDFGRWRSPSGPRSAPASAWSGSSSSSTARPASCRPARSRSSRRCGRPDCRGAPQGQARAAAVDRRDDHRGLHHGRRGQGRPRRHGRGGRRRRPGAGGWG